MIKKANQLPIIHEKQVLGKEFKIYGTFENPLFLAQDVAEWINHSNVSAMLNKIDEDEKQLIQISTINNAYTAWFLTEYGLYEVLMLSRKPIAKEFKKKIKEILKSIRKTGGYVENPELFIDTHLSHVDDITKELILEQLNINKLQNEKIKQQDIIILELKSEIDLRKNFINTVEFNKAMNACITTVATIAYHNNFSLAWSEFFKRLNARKGINLKARKEKGTIINRVKDDEEEIVWQETLSYYEDNIDDNFKALKSKLGQDFNIKF